MIKKFISVLAISIALQGCSSHTPQFTGVPFVKHQSLVDTGYSQQRLDRLTDYVSHHYETTGLMILKDGKVLYQYGDLEDVGYLASVRKSILTMLYGKYVENGTIDLNETLAELGIDEDDGLLPIEKTATVHDILSARSGIFHEPANGGYDKQNALKRGSVKPGEYFLYNNWDFNVAGAIFEMKTGKNIYQALEEQLAIPLGFQDWNINNQEKLENTSKSRFPAYHMYISTRDIAKIGQLMLNNGQWQGQQLISKDWIKTITNTITPVEEANAREGKNGQSNYQFSYGYYWWLADSFKNHPAFKGAYTARGWGGQFIMVIPEENMVIAHKYEVPTLVNWGLMSGGVSDAEFWDLAYYIVTGEGKKLKSLLAQSNSGQDIAEILRQQDRSHPEYDMAEFSINELGYTFMGKEDYEGAKALFKLNVELYPASFNVYDSYGESLFALNQTQQAIEAYERSLALNPDNHNAIKVLAQIRGN